MQATFAGCFFFLFQHLPYFIVICHVAALISHHIHQLEHAKSNRLQDHSKYVLSSMVWLEPNHTSASVWVIDRRLKSGEGRHEIKTLYYTDGNTIGNVT